MGVDEKAYTETKEKPPQESRETLVGAHYELY